MLLLHLLILMIVVIINYIKYLTLAYALGLASMVQSACPKSLHEDQIGKILLAKEGQIEMDFGTVEDINSEGSLLEVKFCCCMKFI